MAKTVADYQVLFDGGFTLDDATPVREKELLFSAPEKFLTGTRKPILAFHARAFKKSRFRVEMNFRDLGTWTLNAENERGLWDPFNWSTAIPEGTSFPKNVPIKFILQEGKVEIGQVVLWYQVEV